MNSDRPIIGIFDSGVGGLSVLASIRQKLPFQPVIYFADQAHVPYGPRSLEEVKHFSEEITRFLLKREARVVVVACNTASAASLHSLRSTFPQIPFVGMEPAVKPAAEKTRSGKVGVLATPATFQGLLYASVVERFANGIEIHQNTCKGLVKEIEAGRFNSETVKEILNGALAPMISSGVDTVVLGCTHYPFVIPMIKETAGENVLVIDPAPAVANQVKRVLLSKNLICQKQDEGEVEFITTGNKNDLSLFLEQALRLYGQNIQEVRWQNGCLEV